MQLIHEPPLHRLPVADHATLKPRLLAALERELDGPHVRRSHLELGRYENTYIERRAIPEIEPLCQVAQQAAQQILGRGDLRLGFWFNLMQPGDRTARHNHEEGGELLSGVYYLEIPDDSAALLVYPPEGERAVPPVEGHFLFFSPRLAHAVAQNRSDRRRVSIAFNFGPAESS